ncbi:MAG: DUF1501 domain-containing protein, partial [Planctomycetes bacterium]|nr:DUF1501 domain-containing protein [Planctomycetota bacterium]
LGRDFDPLTNGDAQAAVLSGDESNFETAAKKRQYGDSRFGRLCWQARHLVECGVRCVTVNLFDRLNGEVTWDCHGRTGSSPSTLFDYRDTLGPQFDRAVSALLDDLADRGLLENTLVVAAGEFGRTPRINVHGGRDHWPGVFSALVAGGGVQEGRIIGASDARGTAPQDRPVSLAELVASIYHAMGMTPQEVRDATISETDDAAEPESPISELFASHGV